ncbi:MAG: hypothetical protein PHW54_01500 [Candidatus Omnitrophica bacterium]|nr:hypothetical protein [Candidatus Omnitrophota bacterium]
MNIIHRERYGYFWASDGEFKRITQLIKASGIFRNNKAIRTQADFLRIVVIVMGEILKKEKLDIPKDLSEEETIEYLVKHFSGQPKKKRI